MTREEAIQTLKAVVNRDCCAGSAGRLEYDALDLAIADMGRNVPMKPIYMPAKNMTTDYHLCANCRMGTFSDYHDDESVPLFCDVCGQAYDWSDEPYYVERLEEEAQWRLKRKMENDA